MVYEVKVNELAEEFGVHRNTIRNWINSGTLPALEGPGRRYQIQLEDYRKLCEKFGRTPRIDLPTPAEDIVEDENIIQEGSSLPPIQLKNSLFSSTSAVVDLCITCGSCSSACPLSGVDGFDPRKIIRMTAFGMEDELLSLDWPWKCTLCGRCEEYCPVNLRIVDVMRSLRAQRERNRVPGTIQKGVTTCLEKGNNIGIPKDDFIDLITTMGRELANEKYPNFVTPIDVRGSRLLITVNSKEPFVQPDDMKWWWKILHEAGESWTISSENWEGVNWGYYTGDDNAMKTMVERIVDNMERLNCQALLLPECGHAYLATKLGLQRWFPEAIDKFKIYSVFDLLLEYIQQQRITINKDLFLQTTALHDSCNYGRKSIRNFGKGYFDEGRQILQTMCQNITELSPNKRDNFCCGAGGGSWSSPFAAERVFYGRTKAQQIKDSEAELIAVACHNCKDQIEHSLTQEFNLNIEVKYIWEMVAEALTGNNN